MLKLSKKRLFVKKFEQFSFGGKGTDRGEFSPKPIGKISACGAYELTVVISSFAYSEKQP